MRCLLAIPYRLDLVCFDVNFDQPMFEDEEVKAYIRSVYHRVSIILRGSGGRCRTGKSGLPLGVAKVP
jgi:predicted nucleic acid-binding Zn ribbon protein